MFGDCPLLISLDLSSFDTSNVQSMNYMFFNCKSLSEIDLSSFYTNALKSAVYMFQNCYNIEYINFKNYNEQNEELTVANMLDTIIENIVICIDEGINMVNKSKIEIAKKLCPTIDCSGDYKAHQKKIIAETNTCIENCNDFKYENGHKCYSTCPEGADFCRPEDSTIYVETTNIATTIKNEEGNNLITSNIITTIINEEGKIITTNHITNTVSYNNLLNSNNYLITSIPTINKDSHEKIDIYETISLTNNPKITESDKYIFDTSYLSNILPIDKSVKYVLHSSSLFDSNKLTEEKTNINLYNITGLNNEEIYLSIIRDLAKNALQLNEKGIIIEGNDNFFYQIITSENENEEIENKNSTNQLSKIDLGECENLLKDHYRLSRNISLIILKFEKITNISMDRFIQYEVYEPINITKLNLSICDNMTIDIYTPVVLSEELLNLYNELKNMGYDLFDINSAFYQDICVPFTTPNGTDVLLDDRINYYYHNNELLCQSNCKFSDYSVESQLLKCECV